MLTRVLEPEVMDSDEEARDYDSMDHSEVNRVFAADFLTHYSESGPVLDVGTGTAQIPIEVCRRHPTMSIVAVDASPAMIALARINIEKAGFQDRIVAELVDAKGLPHASKSFAAVMSNSIVHHIPEPRSVLAEMVRVTAPGGVIFVRDLLRPANDPEVSRLVSLYVGDCNAHQKKLFDDSMRAALSLDEIRAIVIDLGFSGDSVRQTTDRHWTWLGLLRQ